MQVRPIYAAGAARLLFTAMLVSIVTACALNPIAIAETPAQKFYAAKLTYDAVLTGAQAFVADTNAPADLRRSVQQAVAASATVYRSANTAYVDFVAARGELRAGETTSAKVEIATANLTNWLSQLEDTAGRLASLTQSR